MAKGFIMGVGLGGVVSVAAAAGLSLYMGAPTSDVAPYPVAAQKPAQAAPDATPERTPDRPQAEPARRPAAETVVEAPPLPGIDTSASAPEADAPADIAPPAAPEADTAGAAMPAPATPEASVDVAVSTDAPVGTEGQGAPPEPPASEGDLSISTDPAQPPTPSVPAVTSALAEATPAPETPEEMPKEAESESDTTAEDAGRVDAGPMDEDAEVAAVAEADVPDQIDGPDRAPAAASDLENTLPAAEQTAQDADDPAAAPKVAVTVDQPADSGAGAPATQPDSPEIAQARDAGEDGSDGTPRPSIGTPATSLIDREDAVPTGRLPKVAEAAPVTPAADAQEPASPIERFGATTDLAEDLPRMAVVLIDDGGSPLGPDTLDTFPFPLTMAIAPGHPDPEGAATGYRALGFDVMVLVDAPEGAQASDVEVSLQAALAAVPEAVGVLERPGASLQATRDVTEQAASALLETGHGLVMQPNGLNTAQALAARAGVPAVSVFRDFDGAGQDPRVMRRFLDQAAFKARQDGAVIMQGRLQADTISALLLWGLQDRAASVALVPISVVLKEAAGS